MHDFRVVLRLCLLSLLLSSGSLLAQQEVRVAQVEFPPYVFKHETAQMPGLLAQLVEALNGVQEDYHFVLVPTSLNRRFTDLQKGRLDLAVFENPSWGWRNIAHTAWDMGLEDAEVFVARAVPGRDQDYFDDLKDKRLALFHGFHYAFADFNSDPAYLASTFNASLSHSHDGNLLMALNDRADIALVTRSYIRDFLRRYPDYQGQLLVSERVDQRYRHQLLLRPDSPIQAEQFALIYDKVRERGDLARIFTPYQIELTPLPLSKAAYSTP
ncbi:substrate-binding domain-containing protein [Pseudomonas xionganensis]|uniref:Amino acid ABC transporter substrate-binding protein n=1 Tax=Pseudomonas xionganensis TaxID=2654845 RepID=A0A6I4KZC7_9PSED|nr:amino acid ABC transporter substrate-binding protein [Pseudomonas xionganensis]MVW77091.1 amino acid ABC transporter substrate-binding protein [Pseudomonas xionganensis]